MSLHKDLEQEFTEILTKELRQEIDADIFDKFYKIQGWTVVHLRKGSLEADEWASANCPKSYSRYGNNRFAFKDPEDATLFILKFA